MKCRRSTSRQHIQRGPPPGKATEPDDKQRRHGCNQGRRPQERHGAQAPSPSVRVQTWLSSGIHPPSHHLEPTGRPKRAQIQGDALKRDMTHERHHRQSGEPHVVFTKDPPSKQRRGTIQGGPRIDSPTAAATGARVPQAPEREKGAADGDQQAAGGTGPPACPTRVPGQGPADPGGGTCDRTAQNNSVLSPKPVHLAIKQ
jgi:hypothetical protein